MNSCFNLIYYCGQSVQYTFNFQLAYVILLKVIIIVQIRLEFRHSWSANVSKYNEVENIKFV